MRRLVALLGLVVAMVAVLSALWPEVCIDDVCQPATVVASHETDDDGFVLLRLTNDGELPDWDEQVVVDGRRYSVFVRE